VANESVTRVTADASGYRSELDSARKSAQAFMQTQDQASQRVALAQKAIAEAAANGSKASAREINSFVSSLTRAADTAGKTRSELLALKAAQLGIADAASASIAKLRAVEEASQANGEAAHSFSLNSASARRELAVLAHEASQGSWKNFGGWTRHRSRCWRGRRICVRGGQGRRLYERPCSRLAGDERLSRTDDGPTERDVAQHRWHRFADNDGASGDGRIGVERPDCG